MPRLYQIYDVFTDTPLEGNPLAVFPDGQYLDTATMQRIAAEMHLSETVFVLPPDDPAHHARLRIFTPAEELPFAGHPTVGTAIALSMPGLERLQDGDSVMVLEEGVGPVPVRVTVRDGLPVRAQLTAARLPQLDPAPPTALQAAMASLAEADVLPDAAVCSCGTPFLCVPLASREALARARPDSAAMAELRSWGARGLYLFCRGDAADSLHARMFGQALGILEDPATGSAAVALGGWLAARSGQADGTLRWRVHQGEDMGRPSLLELEADRAGGLTTAVRVGGAAVKVAEGRLLID